MGRLRSRLPAFLAHSGVRWGLGLAAVLYGCLFVAQVYVGVTSIADKDPRPQALLDISRGAAPLVGIDPKLIRRPRGLSIDACRFWALDYLRGDCFALIIYSQTPIEPGRLQVLLDRVSAPCPWLPPSSQPGRSLEQFRFGCGNEDRRTFRLVVVVKQTQSQRLASGGELLEDTPIQ